MKGEASGAPGQKSSAEGEGANNVTARECRDPPPPASALEPLLRGRYFVPIVPFRFVTLADSRAFSELPCSRTRRALAIVVPFERGFIRYWDMALKQGQQTRFPLHGAASQALARKRDSALALPASLHRTKAHD